MHHLVREGILEVSTIAHFIGAKQDAVEGAKPAALAMHGPVIGQPRRTPPTHDIVPVELAAQFAHPVSEKADGRRLRQTPVSPFFALGAVPRFVYPVSRFPVVELSLCCYLPRDYLEVVHPPPLLRVEACSGWVVAHDFGQVGGEFWLLLGLRCVVRRG